MSLQEYSGHHGMRPISHTHFMQRLEWEWSHQDFVDEVKRQPRIGRALARDTERWRALIDVAPPGGVVFAIASDDVLWRPQELLATPTTAHSVAVLTPDLDTTGDRSDLTVATLQPSPHASKLRRDEEWGVTLYVVPSELWHGAGAAQHHLRIRLHFDYFGLFG